MSASADMSHNGDGLGGSSSKIASYKELSITSWAVNHGTAVLILFFIVMLSGTLAYRSIPKESFPEIEIPMIAVNTIYPGVSPSDIESLVTRVLEQELNTVPDLEQLTSTSIEGYSSIVAEFSTSVDMEDALERVREKVDLAKPELPADAEEPAIYEFDFQEVPIMQVNLSGEYGLVRLKELGEELEDRLEQIPTVLRVDLRGGREREVKVDVSLPRLQYYGLSLDDIVDAIRDENVNIPGGSIDVGQSKFLVRVDGEIDDPLSIRDFVVLTRQGKPIYVRDVATVDFGFAELESFARLDQRSVVTLDVVKRSGENIIETAEAVRLAIDEMEPLYPPTTVVKITSDMSKDIRMMVSSLENNIVSGLILIVAVLLFYLGLRTSFFVGIAIPTSMLLSFLVLGVLGVTMNMVVLFSLILALGMLVDNAIVVVENTYRYVEEGWDRATAARKATGEVAVPVIAATATTLAAFGPMLFWPGIVGEFMGYLPLTLIVTLSSSLFVALVIVPVLCARYLRLEGEQAAPMPRRGKIVLLVVSALVILLMAISNPLTLGLLAATGLILYILHHFALGPVAARFQRQMLPWITDRYEVILEWALHHRLTTLGANFAILVLTIMAFGHFNHGIEFFPEDIPPRQAWVDVETPVGTRVEHTDQIVRELEQQTLRIEGYDDAESSVATVGGGGGNMLMGGASGPNRGRVMISFIDYKDRVFDSSETLARMQEVIGRQVAGAEISVDKPQEGPPSGPPVNVEISGEDPEVLKDLSDRVLQILRNASVHAQLTGLESDLDEARPELSVFVDREKAAIYGLSTTKVAGMVRTAVQGTEATQYRTGNDEYDVIVRLAEPWRQDLESLRDLTINNESGDQIPLISVADWRVGEGLGSIRRKDMDRAATISSEVKAGINTNAALGDVKETLASFVSNELPPGYTVRYTGQSEDQAEAEGFLTNAFLAALAFIAFILVTQFNSVIKPVIILTSVILSIAGVLLGLMIFQMPFGIIMTGVGIISLAGIVVNNAIVLIDYIDVLRRRDGLSRHDALVRGGRTRLRPVILTAVTTALGLVPLAIGLNFDFFGLYGSLEPDLFWGGEDAAWWGPMAVAVIAGIIFATFLTLVLVPVLYSLTEDFALFLQRLFVGEQVEAEHAHAPAAAASVGTTS
ncbi:MAG: efflux RND transporter permease subunit [Candidatus Latescibacterota bacterium]|nr:efflux RND transporter permease subunit [Candidatus Latescibacterota bacterium]